MTSVCYIYALADPCTCEIRYIGKTDDPYGRLKAHFHKNKLSAHSRKNSWLKSLQARGVEPVMLIFAQADVALWQQAEKYYIRLYRALGCRLTNMTDGGDGVPGCSPGPVTRAKLSAWGKGRTDTIEQCLRNAQANRGRPVPADVRAKIAATHRGMRPSEETRAKLSAARRAVAARKRAENPPKPTLPKEPKPPKPAKAPRAPKEPKPPKPPKLRGPLKPFSAEHRARLSEAAKVREATRPPEYYDKLRASHRTEAYHAKAQALWADPEWREKMLESRRRARIAKAASSELRRDTGG